MRKKQEHFVCQGAICKCIYGTVPDVLQVHTHKKLYYNNDGDDKPAATHKELGQPFKNNSFGSCAKMNGSACAVTVTEWQGYQIKGGINVGGEILKRLKESSKATCPNGSAGCIFIEWHGQSAELSKNNFQRADVGICAVLNPAGDIESIIQDTLELYDIK